MKTAKNRRGDDAVAGANAMAGRHRCKLGGIRNGGTETRTRTAAIVVLDKLVHHAPEMALARGMSRSRHSSLIDRTNRSAYAFALGAWYGVRTIRIPASRRHSRTGSLHIASRSQISTRKASASAMVIVRPTWRMNASSGY